MSLIKYDTKSSLEITERILDSINTKNISDNKFKIKYRSPYGKITKKIVIYLNFDSTDETVVAKVEKFSYDFTLFKFDDIYLTVNMFNLLSEIKKWETLLKIKNLKKNIIENTLIHELMHVEQYVHVHKKTKEKIYNNIDYIIDDEKILNNDNKYYLKRSEFEPIIKTLVCDMILLKSVVTLNSKEILLKMVNEYLGTGAAQDNLLKVLKVYNGKLYKKALKKIYLEFIG